MKKVLSIVLAVMITVPFSLIPSIASAEASVVIDTINGVAPTGNCIAGTLTFVVHGITGTNGGPYSLDLGNGFSTSTVSVISGANVPFSNIIITYTPGAGGTSIYLNLYHGSPSGQDSHVVKISQCVAPPTTAVITVIKNVVNNDQGTAVASNFTLHLKNSSNADVSVIGSGSASPFSGSVTGVSLIVNPGTYSVSEDAHSGYLMTGIAGTGCTTGSVTVVAGNNITCTVTNDDAINTAPTAAALSITTNEDTATSSQVSATDPENNTLTYSIVSNPAHGIVTSFNTATGAFTYTPSANENGSDSFTFKANDGVNNSNTATVSITVVAVNDNPVSNNDSYSTNEDTAKVVSASGVLSNDTDIENSTLSAVLVTDVSHGTLVLNADGSFTYTPSANYNGSDSFTYKANDGTADSNVSTVTINVSNVNDVPVAVADSYSTNEDTAKVVSAPGVLSNDTDVDLDPLTAALVGTPAHGSVTLNSDGSFTYTPVADYNGSDSFTYKANDGTADSGVVTVSLTVTPVNDAPVAQNNSISTSQNTPVNNSVTATDVENDVLSYATTTNPSHGTISNFDAVGGTFTYTPDPGYLGSDSFAFKANDGALDSNTGTVSITVGPVPENTKAACSDGVDNDGDAAIDLLDSDCASFIPQLTVTKVVINDNNGTKQVSDFVLFIDGVQTVSGVATTTKVGSHTVSETADAGYTGTIDGDCDSGGHVTLAIGDTKNCTITNNDIAPAPVTPPSNGGGGGGGGGNGPIAGSLGGGQVLGASTTKGEVLGESCGVYMNKYLRLGSKKNNTDQVKKLQQFLNKELGAKLPVTGVFGSQTEAAVRKFQKKYPAEVLKPWNLTSSTGLVYISTLRQVNMVECPDLTSELPPLVPWSQNPNVQ